MRALRDLFWWTGRSIKAGVERHKLIRRLILAWIVFLITHITYIVFSDKPPVISTGTATAYGIVVGVLATIIGFYKWSRDKDDARQEAGNKKEEGEE